MFFTLKKKKVRNAVYSIKLLMHCLNKATGNAPTRFFSSLCQNSNAVSANAEIGNFLTYTFLTCPKMLTITHKCFAALYDYKIIL